MKRLLFICVENANRSQMAEAFARIHGGPGIEAFSAGSSPSGRVHPMAIEAMGELGYDLGTHRSKDPSDLPDVEFDVAVTMGCGAWAASTMRHSPLSISVMSDGSASPAPMAHPSRLT